MAQVFDRSSNALIRASLALTGLIVIVLGVTLNELQRSPWVTRQGQRPDQPDDELFATGGQVPAEVGRIEAWQQLQRDVDGDPVVGLAGREAIRERQRHVAVHPDVRVLVGNDRRDRLDIRAREGQ